MGLTKKDLKDALLNERKHTENFVEKALFKERNYTEKMMDKKLEIHRDKMVAYFDIRFDELRAQIKDIKKAYEEIEEVKGRLSIMENKLAMKMK